MKTLLHAIGLLLAIITYRQMALADSYSPNSSGNPQIYLTMVKPDLN